MRKNEIPIALLFLLGAVSSWVMLESDLAPVFEVLYDLGIYATKWPLDALTSVVSISVEVGIVVLVASVLGTRLESRHLVAYWLGFVVPAYMLLMIVVEPVKGLVNSSVMFVMGLALSIGAAHAGRFIRERLHRRRPANLSGSAGS